MKNKKTIFNPIKLIGALVFLMAFMLNIQTSFNGEWELVNVGVASGTGGTGGDDKWVCCQRPYEVFCADTEGNAWANSVRVNSTTCS